MAREKRDLDSIDLRHQPKRPKVPTIASVIVEALKVDSLEKLCSTLEPVFRRVVSEEVERALAKLGPARLGERSSPERIEGSDGRNLRLHCKSMLSLPIYTGGKIEGEQGAAFRVALLDANTGHVVTSGPESSAQLDVVVLEGDFNSEDSDDWTKEYFESHVLKEREGKRPLLTGDVYIYLKEGVGYLGELTFTDNSSWIRSRKFRLGLKIAAGFCEGTRVREAKTEAFSVKDHRGELYKKHFPPALKDEVWRLKKIGKDGSFHKRLNKAGIYTVEDFLRIFVRDSQRLRKILGSSMSNKMWEVLVEHAKTCVLSGKHYVYYSDITRSIGAIFNNIYEFIGLIAGKQYFSAESLSDSEKVFADTLLKKAYDNRMHVTEYDGGALLNFKKSRKTSNTQSELSSGSMNTPMTYDQHAVPHHMLLPVPCEQSARDAAVVIGGGTVSSTYNGNQVAKHLHQSRTSHGRMQFENVFIAPQNQFISSSKQTRFLRNESTGLTLGLLQHERMSYDSMDQSIQPGNRTNSYDDGSPQQDHGFLSEEEIRMRSHDVLVNEDMQHLLGVFSMDGASSVSEDCGFSAYMPSPYPNFNFDEERNRSSSKAFIGWLKIKAAMRWGIFTRKKAAERRARKM